MTAPTHDEMRARAHALLDAVASPLTQTSNGVPLRIGGDIIRWNAFQRDARADLWLTGAHPTFELHLTVRGPRSSGAIETLTNLVTEIFGDAP